MLLQDGMRNAFRPFSQAASHGRSIHIPSSAVGKKLPLPPGGVSSGRAKGVFDTARSALTRILYGTQPISTSVHPQALRRAIHTHTAQPFRNQFSFPVRHALSNSPLSFARPPAVQRGMTEVGLGTARKFSTARPIFQHLVQNVPVAGRSMYEMDLDLEKKKGRRLGSKRAKHDQAFGAQEKTKVKRSTFEENLDKYFAVLPTTAEEVSATLVVPLSPSEFPIFDRKSTSSKSPSFIPFDEMWKAFQTHGKHSLRVSKLFHKLDQAKVWDRGAHYEAFGFASDTMDGSPTQSAQCTSLKIIFDGWTAEMVRDVIGETGEGWCMLQESRSFAVEDRCGPYSLESSRAGTPPPSIDMTSSSIGAWDAHDTQFIMPTMDFSSSFLDHTAPASLSGSTPHFEDTAFSGSGASTPWMSDDLSLPSTRPGSAFSDYEMENDWRSSSLDRDDLRSSDGAQGNIAFSAEFMRRSQQMDVWSNF